MRLYALRQYHHAGAAISGSAYNNGDLRVVVTGLDGQRIEMIMTNPADLRRLILLLAALVETAEQNRREYETPADPAS